MEVDREDFGFYRKFLVIGVNVGKLMLGSMLWIGKIKEISYGIYDIVYYFFIDRFYVVIFIVC